MNQQKAQEAPQKTFQELYLDACQKAGDMQYRISMHKIELRKMNKYIKKLNIDAHREIQKQQAVQDALAKKAKLQAVPEEMQVGDTIEASFGEAPEGPKDVG